MSGLPASWAFAALREVTTISPKFNAEGTTDEQLVHFVPMAAASEDFCGIDASRTRPLCEVRKGYTFFAEGDVLFAKITPCMENGKGGLVPCLSHRFAFGSTEFHVLRPSEAIASQWLAHFLSQEEFRKVARHNMTGTAGQLRVPTKWLETVQFPVAPLPEQTRIVEKLEELLGSLDAAAAELKAAQRKLAHYRQALLKAAVEGTLTAQWRAAHGTPPETGADLLQRILQERRTRWEDKQRAKFAQAGKTPPNGWQAKYPEPVAPGTSDLPALPEGWAWAAIDQLAFAQKYGSSAKTSEDAGVPVLRMGNIQEGELDFSSLKYLPKSHEEFPALFLDDGDMLFNRTNSPELVGKTAIYRSQVSPCSYASYLIAVRFTELFIPELASAYINSAYGRKWIKSVVVQQVGQANVNGTKLAALAVPLPPKDEQTQILAILETQLAAAKEQDAALTRALHQATAQRRNLLKAAFTGQLVPQDPADEPASALLARIRASKADTAKPAASKRKAKGTA